jgi:flagellar hook-associated protein 1 FlgK
MLALAGLQTKATLDKGNASYLDVYGRMVANVGAKSQQASITRDAQATLLQQSVAARESVSGVNLDEEAAALIRFQQAYQAAAQVISVANDLFQTLLGAVRR